MAEERRLPEVPSYSVWSLRDDEKVVQRLREYYGVTVEQLKQERAGMVYVERPSNGSVTYREMRVDRKIRFLFTCDFLALYRYCHMYAAVCVRCHVEMPDEGTTWVNIPTGEICEVVAVKELMVTLEVVSPKDRRTLPAVLFFRDWVKCS